MFIVVGAPAHSSFKKAQLLTRLSSISSVQTFDSQWVYLFDQALDEQQHQSALQLLNDGTSFELRQVLMMNFKFWSLHALERFHRGLLKRQIFLKTVIPQCIVWNAVFYIP